MSDSADPSRILPSQHRSLSTRITRISRIHRIRFESSQAKPQITQISADDVALIAHRERFRFCRCSCHRHCHGHSHGHGLDTDTDGAFDAGLLTHIRLNGGSGSASPDQRGHLRNEDEVTALIERATACFGAGTTYPVCAPRGLPSTHCARALSTDRVSKHNDVHGTSRRDADV